MSDADGGSRLAAGVLGRWLDANGALAQVKSPSSNSCPEARRTRSI